MLDPVNSSPALLPNVLNSPTTSIVPIVTPVPIQNARRPDEKIRQTKLFSGIDGLFELEASWKSLASQLGPMEQFDWTQAAAQCTSARSLTTFAVTAGADLLAALPVAFKTVNGVKRAVMLGVDEHFEPMDAIYRDADSADELASFIISSRMPFLLGRLPSDSPFVTAVRKQAEGRAVLVEREQASFPYIALDESWAEPESHLNSGRRSDFRRMRRKAESVGKVTTEMVTPNLDNIGRWLDEAFAVEAKSWKGLSGTAMSCDPFRANHTRVYSHQACLSGSLRMFFLRINDQAAAMQIAIEAKGGLWLLKIGYDASFANCSPGQLLLRESIAYAAKAGLRRFEFLGQSEPWIKLWTESEHRCVAIRVYPRSIAGTSALAADASAKGIQSSTQFISSLARKAFSSAKNAAVQIIKRAGKAYIAGDTVADAVRVQQHCQSTNVGSTIGFWDTEAINERDVANEYLAALDAIATQPTGNYLSAKLPALRFKKELVDEVAQRAVAVGRRLHFDSHGPEVVDRKKEIVDDLVRRYSALDVGFTLPGRWRRSLTDANWVCERGLFVRVVKGQWPDMEDPHRDLREGYLEVICALAGRARAVAVATHDPWLAERAIQTLRAAGTPCELELLYGLPMNASRRLAAKLDVPIRVYIPYGEGYAPYALSHLKRNPKVLWWMLRDSLIRSGIRSTSASRQPLG